MLAALSNRRFLAYLITAALVGRRLLDRGDRSRLAGRQADELTVLAGHRRGGLAASVLLFSLAGGDLADRFDRRTIVASTTA